MEILNNIIIAIIVWILSGIISLITNELFWDIVMMSVLLYFIILKPIIKYSENQERKLRKIEDRIDKIYQKMYPIEEDPKYNLLYKSRLK